MMKKSDRLAMKMCKATLERLVSAKDWTYEAQTEVNEVEEAATGPYREVKPTGCTKITFTVLHKDAEEWRSDWWRSATTPYEWEPREKTVSERIEEAMELARAKQGELSNAMDAAMDALGGLLKEAKGEE